MRALRDLPQTGPVFGPRPVLQRARRRPMFAKLKLRRLRRQLTQSLRPDGFQEPGWEAWLEAAGSVDGLVDSCSEPGWLVHLGYWREIPQDALLQGNVEALRLLLDDQRLEASVAFELAPYVFDWTRVPTDELVHVVVEARDRVPFAGRTLEESKVQLDLIHVAMIEAQDHLPAHHPGGPYRDVWRAGGVSPDELAAASLALTAVAALNREHGHREPLVDAAAKSLALAAAANPEHRPAMLGRLRAAYGW